MQSTSNINDGERTIKTIESEEDRVLVQKHLNEVIEGAAFRGSHRSGQFLKYIVEQAIAGRFECLKERVIGVELFGRAPSYDTGEDAIVRVTASDVRKRLLQHYGRYGTTSRFRINLPPGSYIPEITREEHREGNGGSGAHAANGSAAVLHATTQASESSAKVSELTPDKAGQLQPAPVENKSNRRLLFVGILLATIFNLGIWGVFWKHADHANHALSTPLPWSVFFSSPRPLHLITSDPDIAEIQQYAGGQISTSNYANHNLIPIPDNMTPEIQSFWEVLMKEDKASFVDAKIAAKIAALAQTYTKHIEVHAARNLQMSDLQTDDNYIFLGSPRSNPWSALFGDQLDFQFSFDPNSGQEILRNIHPKPHEAPLYVPTALGGATGQSYAIVALVRNPDQAGQVLLIAGANAEGTEAAGKLVTDMPRLIAALRDCGISTTDTPRHFELLLKLNTMAGSPDNIYVEACHILSDSVTRP
ncbi:hypothetical protein [Edaphobacter acidisoli]|uniref:hypothetical protein n=1 Tax=Edaphobacter acidisoli TaxID=2040573 RepID=UPI0016647D3A|nr:hypothetical protein [Edaphobacter acidisoli]